jgi:hypothetical protein
MHFVLAKIFSFLFSKLVLNPIWNFGKERVQAELQAVALCSLFAIFLYFYVATRVPRPRPILTYPMIG